MSSNVIVLHEHPLWIARLVGETLDWVDERLAVEEYDRLMQVECDRMVDEELAELGAVPVTIPGYND